MNNPKAEITFPVMWEFRIIVVADKYAGACKDILAVFSGRNFDVSIQNGQKSSGGKYQALHISVEMPDRETLNAISCEIVKVDGVKLLV